MRYKIALIERTANWHQPELYAKIASHPKIDLTVCFCSQEAFNGTLLNEVFAVKETDWGVKLLKGYNYKFLKNYSPLRPGFYKTKIFGHLNLGVWNEIKRERYHTVVITMWNDISYWLAAIACKFYNTPFLFATDSTILAEKTKPNWQRLIKRILFGKSLFPMAAGFLFRTEWNRQLYLHYGVTAERLYYYPHSIDYEGLSEVYYELRHERENLRSQYGISHDAFVILFVGRLSAENRPQDLLAAYEKAKTKGKTLVIVGDGTLRRQLEELANQKCPQQHIHFVGFRPRGEVPNFYVLGDLLVLPSSYEPHGDVVKEAMCFGLPVIVSDQVGASADLVRHGKNGFVFPCGDTEILASYIDELSDKDKRIRFGQNALEIIKQWDHTKAINGLIDALDALCRANR